VCYDDVHYCDPSSIFSVYLILSVCVSVCVSVRPHFRPFFEKDIFEDIVVGPDGS
jgi:hypothetical protein